MSARDARPWRTVRLVLAALALLLWAALTPWNIHGLPAASHPCSTYDEAMGRVAALESRETAAMNPRCRLQLMTHGARTERCVVLVHGYSACPDQFHELGERFFARGDNVLIAPLPHHGLADRMTTEHARLTAEELASYADEVVDLARGLGARVIMMGISAGGTTTAWAAQHRADLDLAVLISPVFGFRQVPTSLTAAAMNFYSWRPNAFAWWDPARRADTTGSPSYPRYSTSALAQTLRLGLATRALAGHERPAARRIVVVLNANDRAVNNALTAEVVDRWRKHGGQVGTVEFEAVLKLPHDVVDPYQPAARKEIVYSRLVTLTSP
jgi:alpha-beta hydrolase superfamily lysophospholipase